MNAHHSLVSKVKQWLHRKQRRTSRGQSLVELAITLPFLLVLFLGSVEVSYYMFAANTVHNTAREAARRAARESRYDTITISQWATIVGNKLDQSASSSFLKPTSAADTAIVTHFKSDSLGNLTTCESATVIWPSDNAAGTDPSLISCADLATKLTNMTATLGTTLSDDDFIVVEYYHRHTPIIGLTIVSPNGVTIYSSSIMRIIGQ